MCSRQAASSSESTDEMPTVYKTTRAFLLLAGQQICSWTSVMRNQLLQRGLCGTPLWQETPGSYLVLTQVFKSRRTGAVTSVSSYKCHCAWTFHSETHYSVARQLNQAPRLSHVLPQVHTAAFTHDVRRTMFLLPEIYPL